MGNALQKAITAKDLSAVRISIQERPGDVDVPDKEHGYTPLHQTAIIGFDTATRELIARGASLNAQDKAGRTALHLAAQGGHLEVVKALLRAHALTHVLDMVGRTALSYATEARHQTVAEMILQASPPPMQRVSAGPAPMQRVSTDPGPGPGLRPSSTSGNVQQQGLAWGQQGGGVTGVFPASGMPWGQQHYPAVSGSNYASSSDSRVPSKLDITGSQDFAMLAGQGARTPSHGLSPHGSGTPTKTSFSNLVGPGPSNLGLQAAQGQQGQPWPGQQPQQQGQGQGWPVQQQPQGQGQAWPGQQQQVQAWPGQPGQEQTWPAQLQQPEPAAASFYPLVPPGWSGPQQQHVQRQDVTSQRMEDALTAPPVTLKQPSTEEQPNKPARFERIASLRVPSMYLCPITIQMMSDPVVAADGYTYERSAISSWMGRASTSPMTNLPLAHTMLVPNQSVKTAIREYQEAQRKELQARS